MCAYVGVGNGAIQYCRHYLQRYTRRRPDALKSLCSYKSALIDCRCDRPWAATEAGGIRNNFWFLPRELVRFIQHDCWIDIEVSYSPSIVGLKTFLRIDQPCYKSWTWLISYKLRNMSFQRKV